MGTETTCRVTTGDATAEARVLLETDDVVIRGAPTVRCRIPLSSITHADAANGRLTLRHAGGTTTLDLGPKAATWAHKILNPTPLLDKLGVKPGAVVSVLGVHDPDFLSALDARTTVISRGRVRAGSAVIFLGVESEPDLARIGRLAPKLAPGAALWAIHKKGPAGIPDTAIFAAAKHAGLTYTKVARFSPTHTAEKLVRTRAR
jgi:hypothetical protein